MRGIVKRLVSFLRNEDGPAAVEYAVVLALIVVMCVAAVAHVGASANARFGEISANMGKKS